ncbi:hypothetical protein [Methylosinus sp. RM1]|uniref:hypothetical protein n=1 Tax=Methylosinus sp. RM1 TaxID=2583817 RepID=UPI0014082212|nr:hypothetical protein [Methylosinus sp. RM1]
MSNIARFGRKSFLSVVVTIVAFAIPAPSIAQQHEPGEAYPQHQRAEQGQSPSGNVVGVSRESPPVVASDVASSSDKHQDKREEKARKWLEEALSGIKITDVAMVIFNGCLAIYTWCLWRATLLLAKTGEDQLGVARDAAMAAQKSASAAIGLETPKIFLNSMSLERATTLEECLERPQIAIAVKNHGRTPAFLIESCVDVNAGALPSEPVYRNVIPLPVGAVLEAHDERPLDAAALMGSRIPKQARTAIAEGKTFLWVYGYISYRDFLGGTHVARFCKRFRPQTPGSKEGWDDGDAPKAYTKGY